MAESAILKEGHTLKSIKSITALYNILSIRFPIAPPTTNPEPNLHNKEDF